MNAARTDSRSKDNPSQAATAPVSAGSEYCTTVDLNTWADLQAQLSGSTSPYLFDWAFRGMPDCGWVLKTSLERLPVAKLVPSAERALLTAFKRRAHHYLADLPDANDNLEWLALMQHHGAPTRLLDWTRSPYVGLFFAFESEYESDAACALWAIDLNWCRWRARTVIEHSIGGNLNPMESLGSPVIFNQVFLEATVGLVAPLQPFRMNERLTIQQGVFLCPGDVNKPVMDNLAALDDGTLRDHLHKITVPRALRIEVLKELKNMNLGRATLFPGLDGFARSLGVNVEIATNRGTLSQEMANISSYEEWGF
jgi:hypothetical protein